MKLTAAQTRVMENMKAHNGIYFFAEELTGFGKNVMVALEDKGLLTEIMWTDSKGTRWWIGERTV